MIKSQTICFFLLQNYTVEQKRNVFFKFVELFQDQNFPQELKAMVISHINPSLLINWLHLAHILIFYTSLAPSHLHNLYQISIVPFQVFQVVLCFFFVHTGYHFNSVSKFFPMLPYYSISVSKKWYNNYFAEPNQIWYSLATLFCNEM